MGERKCDYGPLVQASSGRLTCPSNFEKGFKNKDNCVACPKTGMLRGQFKASPQEKAERIVEGLNRPNFPR